ncbi:MAG: hypothetical protein ACRCT8_15960 [Lacipirellulaceae bacterium]
MNSKLLALALSTLVLGWLAASGPVATAETRDAAASTSFTSGAMRSELLLREIATTLRSIDARLERVELLVTEGVNP